MADTANFSYEGNAKLFLHRLTGEASTSRQVRILKVQHLVPITVTCQQGDETLVIPAYMDYGSNTVVLPSSSTTDLDDPEDFKRALAAFIQAETMPREVAPVPIPEAPAQDVIDE